MAENRSREDLMVSVKMEWILVADLFWKKVDCVGFSDYRILFGNTERASLRGLLFSIG